MMESNSKKGFDKCKMLAQDAHIDVTDYMNLNIIVNDKCKFEVNKMEV
jgi:hypothetical protein